MNDYMIAVVRNDKVISLTYSDDLGELPTLRALHKDCDIEVMHISEDGATQKVEEAVFTPIFSRNGRPLANKVRCIETGQLFRSVSECSLLTGISPVGIYKSIRLGYSASGYHFQYAGLNEED